MLILFLILLNAWLCVRSQLYCDFFPCCADLLGLSKISVGSVGVGREFCVSFSDLCCLCLGILALHLPVPVAGVFPLSSFDFGSCLVDSRKAEEKGKKNMKQTKALIGEGIEMGITGTGKRIISWHHWANTSELRVKYSLIMWIKSEISSFYKSWIYILLIVFPAVRPWSPHSLCQTQSEALRRSSVPLQFSEDAAALLLFSPFSPCNIKWNCQSSQKKEERYFSALGKQHGKL